MTALVADPNVSMHEAKAFACQVTAGRMHVSEAASRIHLQLSNKNQKKRFADKIEQKLGRRAAWANTSGRRGRGAICRAAAVRSAQVRATAVNRPSRHGTVRRTADAPVRVFSVGQQSGRLEEMLDRLAVDYDRQVTAASQRLTAVLEPLLILGLVVVVGFIALATILPMLEADDVF